MRITDDLLRRALVYAFLFYVTHELASYWGGPQFFSMWYPTAGVRFAALWLWGPAWLLPMLVVELLVQYFSGFIVTDQGALEQLVSIIRAPICYGLGVLLVQRFRYRKASDAMLLAVAAIMAPALASLSVGIWGLLRPDLPPFLSGEPILLIVTAFMIGDSLGVILTAPFLIWLHHKLTNSGPRYQRPLPKLGELTEILCVLCAGTLLGILFLSVDASISLMPITLGISWIGLRFGRAAAWLALVVSAAVILSWSMNSAVVAEQFEFHIAIAMASIAAFLAGSFSDAQWVMQKEIVRRDRLLFQAERLKTVKAMSLAVIHDASQPLTTLALETQHLVDEIQSRPVADEELQSSALLIQRKVDTLSEMIQRMRRFGGRESEEGAVFSLAHIVKDALEIVRHETRKSGTKITTKGLDQDFMVRGFAVELTQAVFNLMHNAILSAPFTGFTVELLGHGKHAEIHIFNHVDGHAPKYHGFGVGFHIARSIIEAHDGSVSLEQDAAIFHTKITLPQAADHG